MFYKILFGIFVSIIVIITVLLCFIKPEMHSAVLVFDSDYKFVEEKVDIKKDKTVAKLPEVVQQPKVVKQTKKVVQKENKKIQEPKTVKKQVKTTPQQVKTVQNKTVKTQPQTQVQKVTQPKVQTQQVQKTVQPPVQQTLTEKQEEIAWNKWRSNIQNQLMMDAKLPIVPKGTVFKFSFDVDKYGRVTNVQTWSLTPAYTPYAIQYIAPAIRSYQGRSILNFPTGSKRVTTTVTGGWKISSTSKYSTEHDFNDTEVVKTGN